MSQKFRAFDFQSVKQSFMRQEMLEREKKAVDSGDDAANDANSDEEYDDDGNYDNDKGDTTSLELSLLILFFFR